MENTVLAPPPGAHWLIDRPDRNRGLQAQFRALGGTWIPEASAWEFRDPVNAELAESVFNTFLDQTIITDRHATLVRDQLTSTLPALAEIYGARQVPLKDGGFAYEFPTVQNAANGAALVYEASLLTMRHIQAIEIAHELLPAELHQELLGFSGSREGLDMRTSSLAPEDLRITRLQANDLIARWKDTLYEMGVSPLHGRNVERLMIAIESLPTKELETALGFDPTTNPLAMDELLHNHIATAKAIRDATPLAKALAINIDAHLKERNTGIDKAIAAGATADQLGLTAAEFDERQARVAKFASYVKAPITMNVAETAIEAQDRPQSSGAYIDAEAERKGAQREFDGEARLAVLTKMREVLDMENLPLGEEIDPQQNEWLHGKLITFTHVQDHDGRGEFLGFSISGRTRDESGNMPTVPAGSKLFATATKLHVTREGKADLNVFIAAEDGQFFISDGGRKSAPFTTLDEAKQSLAELADRIRISAGLKTGNVSTLTGYAILPVTSFAKESLRNENLERAVLAKHLSDVTLAPQPGGGFVLMSGHQRRPPVQILPMETHVVERPTLPEMAQDYRDVLALTKAQTASWRDDIAARTREKAQLAGKEIPSWAKATHQDPSTVVEKIVPENSEHTMDAEIMNIGRFYVGTRVGFNGAAIHEIASFPPGMEPAVGQQHGFFYTEGLLELREHGQAHVNAVKNQRVSSAFMESEKANPKECEPEVILALSQSNEAAYGIMATVREHLARHQHDPKIAALAPASLVHIPRDGETVRADVLLHERDLGVIFVTAPIENQPRVIALEAARVPMADDLGYLDRVQVQISGPQGRGRNYEVLDHQTRRERVAEFVEKQRQKLSKTFEVAPETIVKRPSDPTNGTFIGDVIAVDHTSQTVVLSNQHAVAPYSLEQINRPLEVGDLAKITSADGNHIVTDHIASKDRKLETPDRIVKELEASLEAQRGPAVPAITAPAIK